MHSCVRWCFGLKGHCHKIFCFRYFHESSSPKPLKIRKFVDLQNLLHLRTFRMWGNLRICGPNIFCNLRICDLLTQIYCGPTTSANLKILYFSAYKYIPKCFNSNFYHIKNSAKQTSSWLLDSFAIKGGNFKKKIFNSLCLIVENLWICNLRTGSPTKFADLQFADQWKEICGLAYLRSVRICDCGLSPRICGFKKTVAWPPLQIYSGAWGKLIYEKNLKSKILWHYPF